jgi:hypothetical protein
MNDELALDPDFAARFKRPRSEALALLNTLVCSAVAPRAGRRP